MSLQLCPTLCDPIECSLPGSSVHRILQARILEWLSLPSPEDLPNAGIKPGSPSLQVDSLPSEPPEKSLPSWGATTTRKVKSQGSDSRYSPPGDLPNPGIEPMSLLSPALASRFFTTSTTWEANSTHTVEYFIQPLKGMKFWHMLQNG